MDVITGRGVVDRKMGIGVVFLIVDEEGMGCSVTVCCCHCECSMSATVRRDVERGMLFQVTLGGEKERFNSRKSGRRERRNAKIIFGRLPLDTLITVNLKWEGMY